MYAIQESKTASILSRKAGRTMYRVVDSKGGLYATLADRTDAEVVAFGLNNGFEQSQFGGFMADQVEAIKAAMAAQ